MKTLDDLKRLAYDDPVVKNYLTLHELNEITLEEALIGMVFTLREQKDAVQENYKEHLMRCATPSIKV